MRPAKHKGSGSVRKVRTTGATLAAVAALALAGCTPGARPELRPDARVVPPDLIFTADDGARLPVRVWRPADEPPRAAVLALHGFGDSRDAWDQVGPLFAAHGVAVYAIDQRGFGGAPGRGHWAGTDRMLEDAAEATHAMAEREPFAPIYVMGESMGGAEVLLLADGVRLARHGVRPRGLVALAPAVWGRAEMDPLVLAALDGANDVAPDWILTGREIPLHVQASDDRAALEKLARDPLTLPGARVSLLHGLVGQMTAAQRAAGAARVPLLVVYGARDQVIPARAAATALARLPPRVRVAYYANGYHLTMRDLDRQAVEGDVLGWIEAPDAPLASGADVLAAGWAAGQTWHERAPAWSPDAWTGFLDGDTRDDPPE